MVIGIDASRANQPEKTGTEWYSWHLIRALAPKLRDHTIRLYVREPLEPGLQHLGDHVEARVLGWPPKILWSHIRLAWELLFHPPDVLFIPADTVPLVRRSRTVTTIHDIAFERFPELYAKKSVQRGLGILKPLIHGAVRLVTLGQYGASELDYHRWSVRHAVRVSQRILTVSEFTKQEMQDVLHTPPGQIVVTGQGVDQPEDYQAITDTDRQAVRQRRQLHKPYFLYVGRLEKKKNIKHLLEGYVAYRQQSDKPADLVLVGAPGYGWAEAQSVLDDPAVQSAVHQLGWLPSNDVRVLHTDAIAFVFLSQYEGFGRPPLESYSAGVPVIAAKLGSLPEVLADTALYVDPTDSQAVAQAMQQLDEDPENRAALVSRGQANVRRYTWRATVEKTLPALLQE